jgi:ATPase subunit of ABC transporter with duplicated ATPase domains
LSSGEKRRTLLALSIGRRPTVLVLDEPTADLDARGTRALGRTLQALPQTILLISHDYDLARSLCRRAVVLAGGRTAVFEDIEALFADSALLDRWGLV